MPHRGDIENLMTLDCTMFLAIEEKELAVGGSAISATLVS
jgi:hypothetical protein